MPCRRAMPSCVRVPHRGGFTAGFLKNTNTIAFYKLSSNTVIECTAKARSKKAKKGRTCSRAIMTPSLVSLLRLTFLVLGGGLRVRISGFNMQNGLVCLGISHRFRIWDRAEKRGEKVVAAGGVPAADNLAAPAEQPLPGAAGPVAESGSTHVAGCGPVPRPAASMQAHGMAPTTTPGVERSAPGGQGSLPPPTATAGTIGSSPTATTATTTASAGENAHFAYKAVNNKDTLQIKH